MAISIKTSEDIEKCALPAAPAAEVLEMIEPYVKPGVSTGELDRICNDYIVNEQKPYPPARATTASRNPSASLLMKWCATGSRTTASC